MDNALRSYTCIRGKCYQLCLRPVLSQRRRFLSKDPELVGKAEGYVTAFIHIEIHTQGPGEISKLTILGAYMDLKHVLCLVMS